MSTYLSFVYLYLIHLPRPRPLDDTLEKTALPAHKMAVSSLGAVVWYLRACSLDIELLSLCRFKRYVPVDIALTDATAAAADLKDEFPLRDQHMVNRVSNYSMCVLELTYLIAC